MLRFANNVTENLTMGVVFDKFQEIKSKSDLISNNLYTKKEELLLL